MASMGETATFTVLGIDALSGPVGAAEKSMHGLSAAADIAGKALQVAFTGAVVAATALAGATAVGVKSAGDLEQAVANISTIKPEIDTTGVFNSLNQMSTRIPQTAAQLGDALYDIFSSVEVSQEGALKLLETFAQGAVGAQTDAKTFGTAVMGVMNAYGLSVEDAGHITDVFFNTVNKGVVTGEELASNLGLVTQSAKMAGVNIDELGAMIAGVTKEGGPAAQNINNLNNLLLKMQTKEAAKGFGELGIAVFNADGSMRPVIDVMGDLKTATEGMTEEAKTLAIQKIFPDLQARAGAAVLMSQLGFVKETLATNITQAGSAEAAFVKMNATFNSQVKILQNTFMSILTTVGAKLLPIITPMITAFSQWLPGAFDRTMAALAPLAPSMEKFGAVVIGIGRYIGAFLASGDYLNDFLADLPEPIQKVAKTLGELGSAFVQFAAKLTGVNLEEHNAGWGQLGAIVSKAAEMIATAFGTIVGVAQQALPIVTGLVTTLVPIVIGLATAVVERLGTAFQFLTSVVLPPVLSVVLQTASFFMNTLLPAIDATSTTMRSTLGLTLSWLSDVIWPAFLSIAKQTIDWFTTVVLPTLPAVAEALRTTLGETVQWLANVAWPALREAATLAWGFIANVIAPELPKVARVLRDILGEAILWVGQVGWPVFLDTARAVSNWITSVGVPAFQTVVTWLGQNVPPVINWIINEGWPKLVDAAGKVSTWIMGPGVDAFTALVDWLGPKISAVVTWIINEGWPKLVETGGKVVTWITGPATEAFTALVDWLGPKVGDVVNWLIEVGWPTLVEAGGKVITWITGPAATAFAALVDWLGPKVGDVVNWIIKVGWPTLVMAGEAVVAWINGPATEGFTALVDWLGPKVSEAVKWIYETGWPTMVTAGEKLWQMIQDGIKWLKDIAVEMEKQKVWDELSKLWEKAWQMGTHLINDVLAGNQGLGAQLAYVATNAAPLVAQFKEMVAVAQGVLDFLNGVADGLNKIKVFLDFMGDRNLFEMITGRKVGEAPPNETLIGPGGRWIDTNAIPGLRGVGPQGAAPPGGGGAAAAPGGASAPGGGGNLNDPVEYIKHAAAKRGMSPEQWLAVFGREGPGGWGAVGSFNTGTSYGPLQLHYAGGPNPQRGMGDDFTRDTGIDLRTDQSIAAHQAAIDYALDRASRTGDFREWYGADNAFPGRGRFTPIERITPPVADAVGAATKMSMPTNINMSNFAIGNQWEMGLSYADAATACGPAAVALFMEATGRTPNVQEVMEISARNGWSSARGMGAFGAFQKTLSDVGVGYSVLGTSGAAAAESAQSGHLTAISTAGGNVPLNAGHYFVAQGFNPETGEFDLGETGGGPGGALKGGKRWMTAAEIEALAGPINGVLQLVGQIGPTFETANASATTAITDIGDNMTSTGTVAADMSAQLSGIGAAIDPVVASMDQGITSVSGLTDAIITSAAEQGVATASSEAYSQGLISQDAALRGVLEGFAATTPAAAELLAQLDAGSISTDQAAIAFAGLATSTAVAEGAVGTMATTIGTDLTEMTATGTEQMGLLAENGTAQAALLHDNVTTTFDAMGNTVETRVDAMGNKMVTTTDATGASVTQAFDAMGNEIDASTLEMARVSTENAEGMNQGVVGAAETMQEGAEAAAVQMAEQIIAEAQQMQEDATSASEGMQQDVTTAAEGMGSDVSSTVSEMVSDISSAFQEIEGPAQDATQAMEEVGQVEIEAPDVGDVVSAMKKIEKAAEKAKDALDDVGKGGGGSGSSKEFAKKAAGGSVFAGVPVIVGDGGRPEMFVPGSDGYIFPSVPGVTPLVGNMGTGGVRSEIVFVIQAPDGRTLEEWYVTGHDLATRRGRG